MATEGVVGDTKTAEALLSAAYIDGRRVGLAGLPIALAEGLSESERAQWLCGWRSGNAQRAYQDAMWSAA